MRAILNVIGDYTWDVSHTHTHINTNTIETFFFWNINQMEPMTLKRAHISNDGQVPKLLF